MNFSDAGFIDIYGLMIRISASMCDRCIERIQSDKGKQRGSVSIAPGAYSSYADSGSAVDCRIRADPAEAFRLRGPGRMRPLLVLWINRSFTHRRIAGSFFHVVIRCVHASSYVLIIVI